MSRSTASLLVAMLAAACASSSPRMEEIDAAVVIDSAPSDPLDAGLEAGRSIPDARVDSPIGVDAGRPPDAGPECALPPSEPLALPSSTVMGTLAGPSLSATTSCTEGPTDGPEAVHRLEVFERTGVVLTAMTSASVILAVRRTCEDARTEVACVNAPDAGGGTPVLRTVLDPGVYWVLVDVYRSGPGGDYTLTLETFPTVPNDSCETATVVTDGTRLLAQDLRPAARTLIDCPAHTHDGGLGHYRYYRATVPAGHRLLFTAMGSAGAPMWIRFLDGCAPSACFYDDNVRRRPMYENGGTTSREVIIAVAGGSSSGSVYDIDVRIGPMADNAVCSSASNVAHGDRISGDTGFGSGIPAPRTCFTGTPPDPAGYPPIGDLLWYRATVPAGHTLGVELRAADQWLSGVLGIVDACGSAVCLGRSSDSPTWTNTGTTARDVLFYVGTSGEPFQFEVVVAIQAPPSNTSCADAVRVFDGTALEFQDASAGRTSLATRCESDLSQGVLFYYGTVAPGERIAASVRPQASDGAFVLRLLDGCTATTCLASGRPDLYVRNARTEWTNAGGVPVDVVIAVARTSRSGSPYFHLDVEIGPPPYRVDVGREACVDVGGGTTVEGITSAWSLSGEVPLPFPFPFFGEAATRFAVAADGYVHLLADGSVLRPESGMSSFGANEILPSPGQPNGILAPLWDNLSPGQVRWLVTGAAPDRTMTVDWTDFAFDAAPGALLRFQVDLHETTGALAFRYCTLPTDARGTGGDATIGVESLDGSAGLLYAFNRPMSVFSGLALRFTPVP